MGIAVQRKSKKLKGYYLLNNRRVPNDAFKMKQQRQLDQNLSDR